MSEHDTYTLRATTSGWDLRLNGERLSLCETFFEAERIALSAVEASRRQSKDVSVYVLTASGPIDLLPKSRPGPTEGVALRNQVQSLLAIGPPALGRAVLEKIANPCTPAGGINSDAPDAKDAGSIVTGQSGNAEQAEGPGCGQIGPGFSRRSP